MTDTPQLDDHFSFEHNGETHTFEKPTSVVRKPGFLATRRSLPEFHMAFEFYEAIAGETALAVIYDMDLDDFNRVTAEFMDHFGASLGESSRS